jgi:hypothetical protein
VASQRLCGIERASAELESNACSIANHEPGEPVDKGRQKVSADDQGGDQDIDGGTLHSMSDSLSKQLSVSRNHQRRGIAENQFNAEVLHRSWHA